MLTDNSKSVTIHMTLYTRSMIIVTYSKHTTISPVHLIDIHQYDHYALE